jgi:hypothetical protein
MWLITERGFYSVVAHRDEPNHLIVRARVRADLVALEALAPLIDVRIMETPDADYSYRAIVTREDWQAAVAVLTAGIDYDNVKGMVAERQGPERAAIYSNVWADLLALEDMEVGR